MPNKSNSLFSTKGFYLGVAVFILGLTIMVSRVIIEINSFTEQPKAEKTNNDNDQISQNILKLQQQLDKKIKEKSTQEKHNFNQSINDDELLVLEHNPILNKEGFITAIEFIDFECSECLIDANFAHQLLKDNENIKLVSKLNNITPENKLHIANIAALVAAKNNKFFEFKDLQIKSNNNNLDDIINNLDSAGVSLRDFRYALINNTDSLLNSLAQDIAQAKRLKINSYAIFINNRKFSDSTDSEYKLKDITVYLNNM